MDIVIFHLALMNGRHDHLERDASLRPLRPTTKHAENPSRILVARAPRVTFFEVSITTVDCSGRFFAEQKGVQERQG